MDANDVWTCRKCGHVNDPNAVRVSGVSFGGSFSSFIQNAESQGIAAQDKLKKYCGNCGAERQKNCFIATAAFGSALAPEVVLLREYRDKELAQYRVGRWIIRAYEKFSPPIALWIEQHSRMRSYVQRFFLSPLIKIIRRHNQTNV